MRDDVAEMTNPVFRYGLDVKDRLDAGERVDMQQTQLDLIRLLADKRWQRLDGDSSAVGGGSVFASARSVGAPVGRGGASFLGIRYALACWLDELFIDHSPWGNEWRDRALEVERFKSAEAAYRFWEQAQRAEAQPGSDALEVYYLCVLLGFRGENRDHPDKLKEWVERVRPQIVRGYGEEPPQADRSEPPNFVPLLTGRERFATMFRWWGIALFVLLFVLVVFLVQRGLGG